MKLIKASLLIFLLIFNSNVFSQTNVIDRIIAVVGKNMIKESELETSFLQSKSKYGIIDNPYDIKCEILEGMLINKLMLHQANVDSVSIGEEMVEREMDNRIKYMIRAYGSQENLEKQMSKSLGEIKEFYKDIVRENLMIGEIEQKLTSNIKITPKEVTEFFNNIPQDSLPMVEEEYEFMQIVKLPIITPEEKEIIKERLNGYRERILKGDKFSTLATLYSQDPGSAKKGGELGFFSRGDMVSEFEITAFSLQPGEISPVIETKYGFHIIQLNERRGDQVNCRHILIQPKVSDMELYRVKSFMDSVYNLIQDKKISFEEAVEKFSDDASKLSQGIMINPYTATSKFQKENLNEIMENIDRVKFETMNKGDITKPILFKTENSNAYRLIKVKTMIPAHKVNLKDDYDKILSSALEANKTKTILEWANKRAEKTYIRIDSEYSNCNFKVKWTK